MPPNSAPSTKKYPNQGHKDTKKQPLSVSERLKRLFTSLCAQIDGGHFSNAVKTCDKILRLEPNDADARQTKLFLLLQMEQYESALHLIDSDEEPGTHAFERAYSLYRLHHESEAKEALEIVKEQKGEGDRGVVHLEAQLSYREGSYQAALDLYNELLDTAEPDTEEHSDILTNLRASENHLNFINKGFLHALDALPASVTSTLETAPPPTHHTSAAAVLSSAVTIADTSPEVHDAKTPKKVRMRRVPAGVIPGVTPPPDPERWLKKSERSTFGQGRRRKGAGGGGGGATQGSASVENPPHQAGAASHPSKGGGGKGKKKR